jgi:hypothetical protein
MGNIKDLIEHIARRQWELGGGIWNRPADPSDVVRVARYATDGEKNQLRAYATRLLEGAPILPAMVIENDTRPCPICGTHCSGCLEDLAAKQEGLRALLSYCRTQADGPTIDGIWGHNEVYDEIAKKLAPLLDGES